MRAAAASAAPATARPRAGALSLTFTRATNGSATLAPAGDHLVAEVQSVLWSLPRAGGTARPLTPADLEPNRPTHAPDGAMAPEKDWLGVGRLMRRDGCCDGHGG